jgi:predicted oxidoreductase
MDRVVTAHNNRFILDRAQRHVPKPVSRFPQRKRDPVREARIEKEAREIEAQRKKKLLNGNG